MLNSIREHATGWLGIVLLGLIALPFALSGVYSYVGGGTISIVAEVGDREISQREYTQAYQRYRQNLQSALGENFRPELIDESLLRREALNKMIEEIALLESAKSDGYRVSEALLAREITGIGAFQTNGVFDRELYQERLSLQGQSAEMFESQVRSSLMVQQLTNGIRVSSFVTDAELKRALELDEQVRSVSYALVTNEQVAQPALPDQNTLQDWYAANGAPFVVPEQVRLDYLELSVDALASEIELSDEDLVKLYEEQGEQLQEAKEIQARHILLTLESDASDQEKAAVLEQAQALRQRIVAGEAFDAIARSESQDPGSAESGGDLGFFGRGMMDAAFEAAAFELASGEVSAPVMTPFGYHLIEVTDARGGVQKTFAEARDTLKKIGRTKRAEEQFYDMAEQLSNLAYEQPDSLEPAATALGLVISQSPWVAANGSEWELSDQRLIAAAFSDEVLTGGNNSEVLELSEDRLIVVRVAEHRAQNQPELSEVRDAVLAAYMADRKAEAVTEQGEAMLARLKLGTRLDAMVSGEGIELVTVEKLLRNDRDVPQAILQTVFRMNRPQTGEVSVEGVSFGGSYALVELQKVSDGEAIDDNGLRPQLAELNAGGELRGVVSGIKSRIGTRIREENL